jgi:hypothetical protein
MTATSLIIEIVVFVELALSGESLTAGGSVVVSTVKPRGGGVAEPLKRELAHGHLVTVNGAGTIQEAVHAKVLQTPDDFGQRFVVREVLEANGPQGGATDNFPLVRTHALNADCFHDGTVHHDFVTGPLLFITADAVDELRHLRHEGGDAFSGH